MNEETQTTLQQALVDTINSVTAAKDFIIEQTPEVIQQLLLWNMWSSLIWFAFGVLLVIIAVCYWIWYAKNARDWLWAWDAAHGDGVATVGGVLISLILVFTALWAGDLVWLQILIAPKVYLIEYAASLVS